MGVASWKNLKKLAKWTSGRQLRITWGREAQNAVIQFYAASYVPDRLYIRDVITHEHFGRQRRFPMVPYDLDIGLHE